MVLGTLCVSESIFAEWRDLRGYGMRSVPATMSRIIAVL